MLTRLRIRNLAVVEDAELEFGAGLNVLTGSTGAGKSLILSAVNLLLGEKASSDLIRGGEDRADVEAAFTLAAGVGTPGAASVTLRRELRSNGRSQAWIDGRPVTARELRDVAVGLIEPHGQNEQYRLRDAGSHVEYLDAFAGNAERRAAYAGALETYRAAARELADFERRMRALREREELLGHRIAELERADLRAGEREELETALRVLENTQRIASVLQAACAALYDDDEAAVSALAQARRDLGRLAAIDDRLAGFGRDVESAEITLKEAVDGMRAYLDSMDHDPDTLQAKQERLDVLIGIERRYGKPVADLIADLDTWREEIDGLAFEDERRAALEKEVRAVAADLAGVAGALSDARRKAARTLGRRMAAELDDLMMTGAAFRAAVTLARNEHSGVEVDGTPVELYEHGVDDVRLYVRPNPGESEGPVDRIASTGETSRIALALKKLTNAGPAGSVLIFDEIDAGVGADLGGVIAGKLAQLAATFQIICITHMPEIAARGNAHLVVSKETSDERTRVTVAPVLGEKRTAEIARMLGGTHGSDHRIALAAELLRSNQAQRRARSRG